MSRYTIIAAVSIVCVCSVALCINHSLSIPTAEDEVRIINSEGKHSPSFSKWKLEAKVGNPLVVRHDGIGSSTPSIKLKPTWFAYIDTKDQAWIYDGDEDITIHSIIHENPAVPGTAIYCLCSYKGEIPYLVKSKVKQIALHHQPHSQ